VIVNMHGRTTIKIVSLFLRKCFARIEGRYKWLGVMSAGAIVILMVLTFRAVRSEKR
jgi:predicted exporter